MNTRNTEGMALLVALLFVVLLAAIVIEYTYEVQVEAARVEANQNELRSRLAAESAVATGMSLLMGDLLGIVPTETDTTRQEAGTGAAGIGYDGLDEPWAAGVPFEELNEAVMQCAIDDEFGKLNLNALVAPDTGLPNTILAEAVRVLFEARGATDDPVGAIIDWIDADDEEQPGGAEMMYYHSLQVPYACKNAALSSVEELLLIRGITPDVFFGDPLLEQLPLTELLTVHGHPRGQINVNTAEYEVLDAIGLATGQTGLAEMVLEQREGAPYLSAEDLTARGLNFAQSQEGGQSSLFDVKSRCFRIRGQGLSGEGKVRIDAYVWRDERQLAAPLRLLDWRVMQ
jgi:general secretion pathway protein K